MTRQRLSKAWWGALILTEFVILWGAVVRATGSGAGCGANWPTCNGEIVPIGAGTETLIEFTHRVTSGLALIVVVALWWVGRETLEGRAARTARWAAVFMVAEAIIGAGLVLFEWTGDDASVGRAIAIAVHLANTFFLLGAIALTAFRAADEPVEQPADPAVSGPLTLGLAALVLVAAAGAVTALGDTLFPAESLVDGLRQDLSPGASFLVNLRVIHPILAVVTSVYIVWTAQRYRYRAPQLATAVIAAVGVQVLAGFVNLGLLAPVWMQIVHLFLADALWVLLVLFTAVASRAETRIAAPV